MELRHNLYIVAGFFMGLATGLGMWAAYRFGKETREIATAWDERLSRPAED